VLAGPHAGITGQVVTDGEGVARFSYAGSAAGTDTLSATVTNASGGIVQSGTGRHAGSALRQLF
jgi:hypothetical protein